MLKDRGEPIPPWRCIVKYAPGLSVFPRPLEPAVLTGFNS